MVARYVSPMLAIERKRRMAVQEIVIYVLFKICEWERLIHVRPCTVCTVVFCKLSWSALRCCVFSEWMCVLQGCVLSDFYCTIYVISSSCADNKCKAYWKELAIGNIWNKLQLQLHYSILDDTENLSQHFGCTGFSWTPMDPVSVVPYSNARQRLNTVHSST